MDVVEQLARSALSLLLASRHSAKQAALDGGTHKHTHTHTFTCVHACVFTGSVDLVCDIREQEQSRPRGTNTYSNSVQCQCAFLLRNCCFHGPAKSLLANNGIH